MKWQNNSKKDRSGIAIWITGLYWIELDQHTHFTMLKPENMTKVPKCCFMLQFKK